MASVVNGGLITLGIETSCDDTALALLGAEGEILGEVVSSQIDDHSPFGGVVPELASRKHQEALLPLLRVLFADAGISMNSDKTGQAGEKVGLIAVTAGPGLMGSLLVGVMAAKGLAQGWNVPIIGVNHLEGHLYANIVAYPELAPPFLCLIVSGGHTEIVLAREMGSYELLGSTRDDAAGEAYDKAAKMLGLGYPGGPYIERAAAGGDERAFDFPVGMRGSKAVEFSFSGLKTSLRTAIDKLASGGVSELPVADLSASFQRAVTDSLLLKIELAVRESGVKRIATSGGVSANSQLRQDLAKKGEQCGWEVFLPPKKFCTDNAVMIAAAGRASYDRGARSDLSLTPNPSWEIWRK